MNNAGVFEGDLVADTSAEMFRRVMDMNVTAPLLVAKAAIPHLRKTKGNAVFVSSIAS